jgi:hypothetical protein
MNTLPGTAAEPLRYTENEQLDQQAHDGGLRPAVGVLNLQVRRSNRSRTDFGDGWTYVNAQFLARWRGHLYLSYIVNPVGEHQPPSQLLLLASPNGLDWSGPAVLFPHVVLPDGSPTLIHQRMSFYLAPDGRLLALSFYGLPPSPNNGRGVARVVREVYGPASFGPIYTLRPNRHAGWDEGSLGFPFYQQAAEDGFRAACEALLADKLATQQWWEEDRAEDGFFALASDPLRGFDAKGFCAYGRPDGITVGLWKWGFAALSPDGGVTWSEPMRLPSLITAGGKVWGERTADGRYALVYNPTPDNEHRWPLVGVSGDDGVDYTGMVVIHGEVPPRRFAGQYKTTGPQYVRGIEADDGSINDNALWLTYGVNKEDLWIARVGLPLRSTAAWPVDDQFAKLAPGPLLENWSIYSPLWAPVTVAADSHGQPCLVLRDADPYDYARATRPFPPQQRTRLHCTLQVAQVAGHGLEIELQDGRGRVALLLHLHPDGVIYAADGQAVGRYKVGQWHTLTLACDCLASHCAIQLDAGPDQTITLTNPVPTVERVLFRSGPARHEPTLASPFATPDNPGSDLPQPDDPVPEAVYLLARLQIESA